MDITLCVIPRVKSSCLIDYFNVTIINIVITIIIVIHQPSVTSTTIAIIISMRW